MREKPYPLDRDAPPLSSFLKRFPIPSVPESKAVTKTQSTITLPVFWPKSEYAASGNRPRKEMGFRTQGRSQRNGIYLYRRSTTRDRHLRFPFEAQTAPKSSVSIRYFDATIRNHWNLEIHLRKNGGRPFLDRQLNK